MKLQQIDGDVVGINHLFMDDRRFIFTKNRGEVSIWRYDTETTSSKWDGRTGIIHSYHVSLLAPKFTQE